MCLRVTALIDQPESYGRDVLVVGIIMATEWGRSSTVSSQVQLEEIQYNDSPKAA